MKKYIKWFFNEHTKTYTDLTLMTIGLIASVFWSCMIPSFVADSVPIFVIILGSFSVYGFFIGNILQPYSIYKRLKK